MPNGNGGEQLMGLPLRDAREVFEREYLVAQISRFGGNISRTAEFVGMERSALHRKLKVSWHRADAAMSRIAYVNGRYVPHPRAMRPHRGPRLINSPTASMKSARSKAAGWSTSARHMARLDRSLSELRIAACRCRRRRSAW